MTDLLTLGETMVSVRTARPMRLGGEAQLSIAGSETNVAIGLCRLGHQATWVGAVGNDEPGRLIQRTLRAEGVDTSYLRFSNDSFTGFIAFDQPSHDITRVSYHRRGSAGSTLTADESIAAIDATQPRLLHVTGITPALSDTTRAATLAAVRTASAAGVQVSLDVNYRARLWSRPDAATAIRELLPYVHTVFASDDELDLLTDAPDAVSDLLAHTTVDHVIVTAGGKGAWAALVRRHHPPPRPPGHRCRQHRRRRRLRLRLPVCHPRQPLPRSPPGPRHHLRRLLRHRPRRLGIPPHPRRPPPPLPHPRHRPPLTTHPPMAPP